MHQGEDWQSRKNFTQTEAASALRYLLKLVKHEPASVLRETWEALTDLADSLPGAGRTVDGVTTPDVRIGGRPQRAAKLPPAYEVPRIDAAARKDWEVIRVVEPARLIHKFGSRLCRGKGRPLYPQGVTIQKASGDREEEVLPLIPTNVLGKTLPPRTGNNKHEGFLSPCAFSQVQVAYCWAMMLERELRKQGTTKLHMSLRARDRDIHLIPPSPVYTLRGESAGVAWALMFLQLFTECAFIDESVVTGLITLGGEVQEVDSVLKKYNGVRGWARRFTCPARNADDLPVVDDNKKPDLCRHIACEDMHSVMENVVKGWRRSDVPSRASIDYCRVFYPLLVENPYGSYLVELEGCLVPGTGQRIVIGGASHSFQEDLGMSLLWVETHATEIVKYLRSKLDNYKLQASVDIRNMCLTRYHPHVDEVTDGADGEVPHESLDLYINMPRSMAQKECNVSNGMITLLLIGLMMGLPCKAAAALYYVFAGHIDVVASFDTDALSKLHEKGVEVVVWPRSSLAEIQKKPELAAAPVRVQGVGNIWDVIGAAFGPGTPPSTDAAHAQGMEGGDEPHPERGKGHKKQRTHA